MSMSFAMVSIAEWIIAGTGNRRGSGLPSDALPKRCFPKRFFRKNTEGSRNRPFNCVGNFKENCAWNLKIVSMICVFVVRLPSKKFFGQAPFHSIIELRRLLSYRMTHTCKLTTGNFRLAMTIRNSNFEVAQQHSWANSVAAVSGRRLRPERKANLAWIVNRRRDKHRERCRMYKLCLNFV